MSSRKLIGCYLRERFRVLVFGPLSMLIYLVGCVASGALPGIWEALAGVATVGLLMLAFRVMDDLIDRDADRLRHPTRITVRADRIAPFIGLSVGAFAVACLLAMWDGHPLLRLSLCTALALFLAGWSRLRRRLGVGSLVHAHVLLAKYPAIAVIASPSPTHLIIADAGPALLALYLGFCVYETLDDPVVRGARGAGPIMTIELVLLAGLQLFTLTRGASLP